MNAGVLVLALSMNQGLEGAAVQTVIPLMKHDSYQTREWASREILKFGPAALPQLAKAIATDPSPELHRRAAQSHRSISYPIFLAEQNHTKRHIVSIKAGCSVFMGTIVKSTPTKTYILTASTPLDNADEHPEWPMDRDDCEITVRYGDRRYDAKLVKRHETRELAVISIDKGDLPVPPFLKETPKNDGQIFYWNGDVTHSHEPDWRPEYKAVGGVFDTQRPQNNPFCIPSLYGSAGTAVFYYDSDRRFRVAAMAWGFRGPDHTAVHTVEDIREFLQGLPETR